MGIVEEMSIVNGLSPSNDVASICLRFPWDPVSDLKKAWLSGMATSIDAKLTTWREYGDVAGGPEWGKHSTL